MKRNILLVMVIMAAAATQAQIEHNLGVQVGWNRQIYRLNEPSQSKTDKNKLTFTQPFYGGRLGLVYELSHESGMGLYTAFSYLYGWNKSKWESVPYVISGSSWKDVKYAAYIEYSYSLRQHILELSAQPQYKFEIADRTYIGLYTGPAFQYIAQYEAQDFFRYNNQNQQIRYYVDRPYKYSKEALQPYFRDWNLSWGVGLSVQYDRYYIRGGYDFGLVNPYKMDTFGAIRYWDEEEGQYKEWFKDSENTNQPDTRRTRGRLDSWQITLGVFFWQTDN